MAAALILVLMWIKINVFSERGIVKFQFLVGDRSPMQILQESGNNRNWLAEDMLQRPVRTPSIDSCSLKKEFDQRNVDPEKHICENE